MKSSKTNNLVERTTFEALQCFDEVFKHRIVQKLSRPISLEAKEKMLENYRQSFNKLHTKLQIIRRQSKALTQTAENANKTEQKSTKAIKTTNMRNHFRKIQSRYIQLFIDGSFKYYPKLVTLYSLPSNFYLIDINGWTTECLGTEQQQKCC